MVAIKQAHLVQERTGAEVYSFYIDLRWQISGIKGLCGQSIM